MKKHFKNVLLTLIGCQIFIHQSIASENYPQVEIVTTSGSFIIELDKNRANRIKALGNSIVPEVIYEIGNAIYKAEEANS